METYLLSAGRDRFRSFLLFQISRQVVQKFTRKRPGIETPIAFLPEVIVPFKITKYDVPFLHLLLGSIKGSQLFHLETLREITRPWRCERDLKKENYHRNALISLGKLRPSSKPAVTLQSFHVYTFPVISTHAFSRSRTFVEHCSENLF